MRGRMLQGLIEQAEAELARVRRTEAVPEGDLLARLRARVLGGTA
jgi:hypothetical protein